MAYGGFKDLARGRTSDNVLRDKAFNIAKNPKDEGYTIGLVSMVYKFFNKKSAPSSSVVNNEIKQSLQLAEELHKSIIGHLLRIYKLKNLRI